MSHAATGWAMPARCENAIQKTVLLILADCHNAETGQCNPSIKFLSDRSCSCENAVRKAVKGLEGLGLLRVRRTRLDNLNNLSNQYELALKAPHPVKVPTSLDAAPPTPPDADEPGTLLNQELNSVTSAREPAPFPIEAYQAKTPTRPPEDFQPTEMDRWNFEKKFPDADVDLLIDLFKTIEFKSPRRWSTRWYSFAMENARRHPKQSKKRIVDNKGLIDEDNHNDLMAFAGEITERKNRSANT